MAAPDCSGLRVLQLGPLYVNHVRRWSEKATALGCVVSAAGHVRPERRLVALDDVAERVEVAPAGLWESDTARRVEWLRGVLRRVEPDLVHAHWLPTWGCYAALSERRPLVLTPWGSDLYLAEGPRRCDADRALACADAVIVRSRHMRAELFARRIPPERIHEVQLGVDLERFRPASADERAALRRELDLPDGTVILSFRAGTDLYNLDVVLDAFELLRARLPDATLVLVHGDAPLAPRVRAALDGAQSVRHVGSVAHADIAAYMRAADVGISIPSSDGSPSSVWEALACGLPLVLSDLPQIAERVGDSGAVSLVEPRPGAVAAALFELAARRDEMARAGRAWAVATVDAHEHLASLGRVYTAALRTGSGRRALQPA